MTLDPLIHAPLAVQAHVATVVPACLLGVWLLALSHRGSRWHRRLGVAYFTLLVATALIPSLSIVARQTARCWG